MRRNVKCSEKPNHRCDAKGYQMKGARPSCADELLLRRTEKTCLSHERERWLPQQGSNGAQSPDFRNYRSCQFWDLEERGRMPRTLGTGHAARFLSSSLNDVSKLPNISSSVPPTCR